MFLLNDVVFRLEDEANNIQLSASRFDALTFPAIIRLGQELFSTDPLLQHSRPERARRLGALISTKIPLINAALFVAPTFGCTPNDVTVRFVSAQFEVMADFYSRQLEGPLSVIGIDQLLWNRLAA